MVCTTEEPSQLIVAHRETREFHSKSESKFSYACYASWKCFFFFLGHFVGISSKFTFEKLIINDGENAKRCEL